MRLPLLITLALLGGLGVLGAYLALVFPPLRLRATRGGAWQAGLQVRLTRAGLGVDASTFLTQGALYGLVLGGLAYLASAAPAVVPVFFVGGFIYLWVTLEDQRNTRVNAYHRDLATAMDIIGNAWQVRPALSTALEAVITFAPGAGEGPVGATGQRGPAPDSVAADFAEIQRSIQANLSLRAALQTVADRRSSPIFDGLAMALLVADEQGAAAGELLRDQARTTRQQVEAYHESLTRQKSSRSEIRNGTVGPWSLLLMVRALSGAMLSQDLGVVDAGQVTGAFFWSPLGLVVGALAAGLSVGLYAWAMQLASRGLLLRRVPTEHGQVAAPARPAAQLWGWARGGG